MLPIMLSAIQGWSAGTCSQRRDCRSHEETSQLHSGSGASRFKTLTWDGKQILGECERCRRTYKVASSKNPVEMQVLVGPDECLGSFAGAAVQRLPRQAQEGLQPIPSEISSCSSTRTL